MAATTKRPAYLAMAPADRRPAGRRVSLRCIAGIEDLRWLVPNRRRRIIPNLLEFRGQSRMQRTQSLTLCDAIPSLDRPGRLVDNLPHLTP